MTRAFAVIYLVAAVLFAADSRFGHVVLLLRRDGEQGFATQRIQNKSIYTLPPMDSANYFRERA